MSLSPPRPCDLISVACGIRAGWAEWALSSCDHMSQTTCHLLLGPYQDGASQASHRHGIADGAFAELYTLWSAACVLLAPFPARRSTRSPTYGSCTSSGGLSLLEQIAWNTSGGSCTCLASPNAEETLHVIRFQAAEPVWRPHSAAWIGLYIPNQGGQI